MNHLSLNLSSLMRQKSDESVIDRHDEILFEVSFAKGAQIAECFESAIKCWRIFKPNIILVEKQALNDQHIEKLCKFLSQKNMIIRLNVRRNKISNEGAKRVAKFIKEEDNALTHLDIERNRVGTDGGTALLDALSTTTRFVNCNIVYGNPISSQIGQVFEREIKANAQALESKRHKKKSKVKWELIDKGPDYMRCAIKMTELKNILYLSLPDNMLGLEDARMLSDLLMKNTPLRNLNLSQNSLDADCAALISNSLIYNSNLKLLDVSENCIGDLGVFILLTPIIRKELQAKNITEKKTPIIPEKELTISTQFVQGRIIRNGFPILQQVSFINIMSNETTNEVYKIIHLVQITNPWISIMVEDPQKLIDNNKESETDLQSQPAMI